MIETILMFFKEYSPTGLVFLIFGWLVWKFARLYFVRFSKIEKNSAIIDIVKKDIEIIKQALVSISTALFENKLVSTNYYMATSPLSLTDMGKNVLDESGAINSYASIKTDLIKTVISEKYDSYLDLAQKCHLVIMDNEKYFSTAKNFVYNNPTYQKTPLKFSDIVMMLSIVLREDVIAENDDIVLNKKKGK